jgi:hypothetical protein
MARVLTGQSLASSTLRVEPIASLALAMTGDRLSPRHCAGAARVVAIIFHSSEGGDSPAIRVLTGWPATGLLRLRLQ